MGKDVSEEMPGAGLVGGWVYECGAGIIPSDYCRIIPPS